jgi:hypothetical protein
MNPQKVRGDTNLFKVHISLLSPYMYVDRKMTIGQILFFVFANSENFNNHMMGLQSNIRVLIYLLDLAKEFQLDAKKSIHVIVVLDGSLPPLPSRPATVP